MTLPVFLLTSLLWTGLIAGLAEALTRGRIAPKTAQAIWRGAAILMILPWLATAIGALIPDLSTSLPRNVPWADFLDAAEQPAETITGFSPEPATGEPPISISAWLLLVLIGGWMVRLLLVGRAYARLVMLRRTAEPLDNAAPVFAALQDAAQTAGLKTPPRLATTDSAHSPSVSGLFRPVLLIPRQLLDSDTLRAVFLHECVHIARGDLVTRPLERAVADLLWFSPFAWLARARLDHWREAVCDRETVRLTGDRVAYARALSQTARLCRPAGPLPAAALFWKPKRTLPMRIESILNPPTAPSRLRLIAGAAVICLALPLAWAQGLNTTSGDNGPVFSSPIISHPDAKITSSYGLRMHPIKQREILHVGTDIGAPLGTPIHAPAPGEVITTGERRGYGKIVEIELDGSKDRLRFAQLKSYSVKVGDRVQPGEPFAKVGASGEATGPHLHFEYLVHADGDAQTDAEAVAGLVLLERE